MIEELTLGAKLLGFGKKYWPYIIGPLIVAGIIAWALIAHHNAAKRAHDAAYQEGIAAQQKVDAAALIAANARAQAITAPIRKQNDETNTRIAGDADDLRLRGPGKASVSCRASAPASGDGPRGNQRTDADPSGPAAEDGLSDFAAVPWGWLVGRAEQADLDRAEVLAWRDWYVRQSEAAKVQPQEK